MTRSPLTVMIGALLAALIGGCQIILGVTGDDVPLASGTGGNQTGGAGGWIEVDGGVPLLTLTPLNDSFGPVKPGSSLTRQFTLTNNGNASSDALGVAELKGADADDFAIAEDTCVGKRLHPTEACTVGVRFQAPPEPFDGDRAAELTVTILSGAVVATATLTGVVRHWRSEQLPDSLVQLNAVYAQSTSSIFAVGSNGTVLQSKGKGDWQQQSAPIGNQTLNAVYGTAGGHIYAGGAGVNLIHQGPGSTAWSLVAPPPSLPMTTINAIWASPKGTPNNRVFVFGDGGKFFSFDEDQSPATAQPMGASHAAYGATGVYSSSVLNVTVVGESQSIQYYSDAAGEFTKVETLIPASVTLRGVFTLADGTSYAAGSGGALLKKGAGAWVQEAGAPDGDFYGVWAASATEIYVVGAQGVILRSDGSGTWTSSSSHTTATLRAVVGVGTDVYAVGDGVVLRKVN